MKPSLYDVHSIEKLDWTTLDLKDRSKKYLAEVIKKGINSYISNVHSDVYILRLEDLIFPIVVPHQGQANSYICSPYGHYILYAMDNLQSIQNGFLQKTVKAIFRIFGGWLRKGSIDSVVYVNHNLLSIDLYPKQLSLEKKEVITDFLSKYFPDKAIVFRSVNAVAYPKMGGNFLKLGYKLFPTRYVYLADTKKNELFQRRIIKSDVKLFNEMPYEVVDGKELNDADFTQLCAMYQSVYIEGHSKLNPQITPEFIALMSKHDVVCVKALKDRKGAIKGFVGFQVCENTLLCPLFGYNKADGDHASLYRLLNTLLLLEAKKNGYLFNAAAGASFFKKIRYPLACMETKAVYYRHLPRKARLRWSILNAYANKIAARFMKNY